MNVRLFENLNIVNISLSIIFLVTNIIFPFFEKAESELTRYLQLLFQL